MYLPSQAQKSKEEVAQDFWAEVGKAEEIDEELQPYLKKKGREQLFVHFPEEVLKRSSEIKKWLTTGHISQSIPGELNDQQWKEEQLRVKNILQLLTQHRPLYKKILDFFLSH